MPGFDESLTIPTWLEPPRMDADETLPNMIHPSYPFGRPSTHGKGKGKKGGGVGNMLNGVFGNGNEDVWDELGSEGLVERRKGREVPPGMAVSSLPLLLG